MRSNILVHTFFVATLISSASPWPARADETKQEELTAQDILDRMVNAYAECKSYQDSGQVQTVFIQANGRRTDKKPFATAFLRPDRFRFEYKSIKAGGDEARHIIWRQGSDIQTWWDIRPGVERPSSLEFAVSAAQGVSSGASGKIPRLLMPNELGGVYRLGLANIKRISDETLDSVECFRIEGSRQPSRPIPKSKGLDPSQLKATEDVVRESLKAKGVSDDIIQKSLQAVKMAQQSPQNAERGPQRLWIDKAMFLVRRVDEQTTFENFRTETTTKFYPIINGAVSEQMLEFNSPQQ
jgi:outer membrane lipoprotein-sorting protein